MTQTTEQALLDIRDQIDAIDEQIQALISQRARLAKEVARIKTQGGQVEAVFYRPEREAQVLRRVIERNDGSLPAEDMARLFREIMSACLALEQPLRIAYLGPEGSYSHAAVLKQFGSFVHPYAVSSIEEVFKAVERREAHYGVVPVENSSEGVVSATQNCLIDTPLQVCGELDLPIHHCLLSNADSLEKVRKVVAHAQALAQCRNWLQNNLPHAELEAVESNARAAQLAQQNDSWAAIASEQAAQIYTLRVLEKHIEDNRQNTTKFWVMGHEATEPSGEDKTALILTVPNKSGALLQALEPFAREGISMTRIISRPAQHKTWDYLFFIDILGHQKDERVCETLEAVAERAAWFKLLGSYPVSPLK